MFFKGRLNKNSKNFMVIGFMTSLVMSMYFMIMGIYLKEIGYGEEFVGRLYSIQTMATGIGSLISIYFLDGLGRKKSFGLSLLFIFWGGMGQMFFASPVMIILHAIIAGVGFSVVLSGEALFLTENTKPENRVMALSVNFVLRNLGMMAGVYFGGIGTKVLSKSFSNVDALKYTIIISLLCPVISIVPLALIRENEDYQKKTLKECIKSLCGVMNRDVLTFMTYNSLVGMGAGMVVPFFSIYLKYSMSIGEEVVGNILSIAQLGCVLGGMVIPLVVKRLGRVNSVLACQLLSIPFLLSIAFPQGIALVAVSFFMRSSLMNMARPVNQNISMDMVEPSERANMGSMFSLSNNISRAVGIYIGGYLMENFSYNTPYYFTVALYLMGSLIFARLFWRIRKRKAANKIEYKEAK